MVKWLDSVKGIGVRSATAFGVMIAVALTAAGFVSCTAGLDAADTVRSELSGSESRAVSATSGKRVVGYFCEWGIYAAHDQYYVTSIPFDKLTHINYAFVGLNPSTLAVEIYDPWATLEIVYPGEAWDTPYKGNLGMLQKMKLQYPNVKVLISVGGWTKSHGFHAAAATASSRATAAANLVAFMKQYGLDGVDIDWEYPGVDRPADTNDPYDKGSPGGSEDTVNFNLFLKAIRDKLDEQGAADGRHYELTAAVGVGYDKIAVTQPGVYTQYLDAVNLMTYDMHGGFETVIGHQAPLYANPYDTHDQLVNERYNVDWAVNEFLRQGVSPSKIVLGVPFYSRGWNDVSGGWDADGNGTPDGMFGTGSGSLAGKWGVGGQSPYFTVKQLATQSGWEKFRDPYSKVPWLYNRAAKELYTFDDAVSIGAKMDYALAKGLGGAMYWELDGDDWKNGYDLVNVIADKMLTNVPADTNAPSVPGNLAVPSVTQSSVNLAWSASTDNVGVAGYTVAWSASGQTGGSKTVTGTATAVTGLAASATYTFSVTAYDAAGNRSAAASVSAKTSAPVTDTQAPAAPAGLALVSATHDGLSVSWNASTDNIGVAGYEVLVDGSVKASANDTSATLSGLAAATAYSVSVRAFDAAGNRSAASAAVSMATKPVEENGPATGVPGTPSLQQSTWNGEASFSLKMDMWWGNNGTRLELLENGVVVHAQTLIDKSPAAQSVTVAMVNKANGTYRYVARLTNRFGSATSNALSYTVTKGTGGNTGDTQAPTAPANAAVSNVTASGATVSWNASSDDVGVTVYDVSWTGPSGSGTVFVTGTSCALSGLAASTAYAVTVKAKDAAGNESAAASVSLTTASDGGNAGTGWVLNGSYTAGQTVTYLGSPYKCLVTHVAYSETWNPQAAPTLWQAL